MSAPQPGPQSLTDKIKSAFGLPSQSAALKIKVDERHQQPSGLTRQDSFPEMCSTPSEVGIFEVAHNKSLGPDGKFSWRKFFFEAPGSSPRAPPSGPASGSGSAASQ